MKWENFEELFHPSWYNKIKPWVESEDCDRVYAFLKRESKRGKKITPLSSNVFRAFKETSYDDLKVIMVGLSPYHTFYQGKPVADGLLMSCSVTGKLQPSLEQFYSALENELYKGLNLHIVKNADLKYLANQGVLLLNASLTCEMNKPGSHLKIWKPFMIYLFENVFDMAGAPFVFLGAEASKYSNYVPIFTHHFEISHPASAAYSGTDWDSEGVFKKLNKILKDNNNESIKWMEYDS